MGSFCPFSIIISFHYVIYYRSLLDNLLVFFWSSMRMILVSHASFAFNSYYHINGNSDIAFKGILFIIFFTNCRVINLFENVAS